LDIGPRQLVGLITVVFFAVVRANSLREFLDNAGASTVALTAHIAIVDIGSPPIMQWGELHSSI
jgi:hypothetical protein